MKPLLKHAFTLLLLLTCFCGVGQDLIVKTNGDSIKCRITEIAVASVSYYKHDLPNGPLFTVNRSEVKQIRLANGETLSEFATGGESGKTTERMDSSGSKGSAPKNKIELLNDKYYINGTAAKKKDVNRYLSKSSNPVIQLGLKGAKSMSLAQKITKITSYPTTIGGGLVSIVKIAETYQLVQRGRATGKAFFNTGMSIVGTMALPVTSKFLKKKSDKMYDKLIDLYNVTN